MKYTIYAFNKYTFKGENVKKKTERFNLNLRILFKFIYHIKYKKVFKNNRTACDMPK